MLNRLYDTIIITDHYCKSWERRTGDTVGDSPLTSRTFLEGLLNSEVIVGIPLRRKYKGTTGFMTVPYYYFFNPNFPTRGSPSVSVLAKGYKHYEENILYALTLKPLSDLSRIHWKHKQSYDRFSLSLLTVLQKFLESYVEDPINAMNSRPSSLKLYQPQDLFTEEVAVINNFYRQPLRRFRIRKTYDGRVIGLEEVRPYQQQQLSRHSWLVELQPHRL